MGTSRNFTDGAPRRRVRTDSLEERIDLAGAGRVREDAIEDTEPARLRVVRDGDGGAEGRARLLEVAEDLDVLGRRPMSPVQNDCGLSSST